MLPTVLDGRVAASLWSARRRSAAARSLVRRDARLVWPSSRQTARGAQRPYPEAAGDDGFGAKLNERWCVSDNIISLTCHG